MDKENYAYIDSINNIRYQVKKVVALANLFSHAADSAMIYAAKKENYSCEDPTAEPLFFDAQVYADLLLSSFASLVDYYFIAVAIKLNIPPDNMGCVQYKKITNDSIEKSKGKSWESFVEDLSNELKVQVKADCSTWNRKFYNISGVIKAELVKWGVFDKKASAFYHELRNEVCLEITLSKLIEEYYIHTEFLHCYYGGHGHKFNIFIELNNFLKHNRCPLIKYRVDVFDGKSYAYAFYEIKEENYKFLKEGIIRTIASVNFDELEFALNCILKNNRRWECLENKHLLSKLSVFRDGDLKVDGELYFKFDNVLMSRSRDSISIHTKDLCAVTGDFIRYVEEKLNELFISSPEK